MEDTLIQMAEAAMWLKQLTEWQWQLNGKVLYGEIDRQ